MKAITAVGAARLTALSSALRSLPQTVGAISRSTTSGGLGGIMDDVQWAKKPAFTAFLYLVEHHLLASRNV